MTGNGLGKLIWRTLWGTIALCFWCMLLGGVVRAVIVFFKVGYGLMQMVLP